MTLVTQSKYRRHNFVPEHILRPRAPFLRGRGDAIFDYGTGWPTFDEVLPGAVAQHTHISHGMVRTEITGARRGSHLGHVFDEGSTASGKRYCINSVRLNSTRKSEPRSDQIPAYHS